MTQENDLLLSRLAVRLRDNKTKQIVGSGILYYNSLLKDKVYIFTAAHNLFADADAFAQRREEMNIDIFNPAKNFYQTLFHRVNFSLVSPQVDKDVAVLLLEKTDVEAITGKLPIVHSVQEQHSTNTFSLKGFPNATQGEELVCLNPKWIQKMIEVDKFQLQLTEDYNEWAIGGFSGSGIFLRASNQLYLFGIFTRFRREEKGKVIYCQYLSSVNELLQKNYLPTVSLTYLGEHGVNPEFFRSHIDAAVRNLGPRFSEVLNLRLPINYQFNDLAKDSIFKERVLAVVDKWLVSYIYDESSIELVATIESDYSSLREKVVNWAQQISWNSDENIEVDDICANIHLLNNKVEEVRKELYELQFEEMSKNPKKEDDYSYQKPFQSEINRLIKIHRYNCQFLDGLDNINFTLSNYPCLLIQGGAGHGKSHLLGDVAKERLKNDQPTLLLLGQLFRDSNSVWLSILNQLGLSCTKGELLSSLNRIGQQTGVRVLIMIDALNEGNGKEIWPNELAGFIHDISKYPHIGLALTVRTSYFRTIIPEALHNSNKFTQITHEGFKGNEYAALRLFCEHYGLKQPNFPILSPEFTSPLLLRLLCEGVRNSGRNELPFGLESIHSIFSYYLKAVCKKLSAKREMYRCRHHVVNDAIQKIAKAMFEQDDTRGLSIDSAIALFDNGFSSLKYLLDDLLLEGIFIQNVVVDKTGKELEFIYFAYERLGDFYMAKELLKSFGTPQEVRKAFKQENTLGKLLEEYRHNNGILETLAILLPEKFSLEIFEVYHWALEAQYNYPIVNVSHEVNQYFVNSLKWRDAQSIDESKITDWLRSGKFNAGHYYSYINLIIELTVRRDHPFNGDRLHRILSHHTMPKRDAWWQHYTHWYSGYDDYDNAYPLKRLIDWAWQSDISDKIDVETARLVGQTLAWVLASTNISLRDQTTKAMVNILEQQPDALIAILKVFNEIDDLHIKERLYGVAYGCALRTRKLESLQTIAQYIFDHIFKDTNPPTHILLRDYARNTVEYALYKKMPIEGNVNLIKPPYNSHMPVDIPTQNEIESYKIDYEDTDFQEKFRQFHNQIQASVIVLDFGRYEVDSALRNFMPYSFTADNEYKNFLKSIKQQQRNEAKLFEKCIELKYLFKKTSRQFHTVCNKEKREEILDQTDTQILNIKESLRDRLASTEADYFFNIVIPHIELKYKSIDDHLFSLETDSIKRWIVKRVFELGYDSELHGRYESSVSHLNGYSDRDHKVERIGKKYQWIAFYEIMGMVADNYMIKEDRWSRKAKPTYFQGAWQNFLRNVDPAFTTTNEKLIKEKNEGSDRDFVYTKPQWWEKEEYNHWNTSDSNWAETKEDLPDPKHSIIKIDEYQEEWLYLNAHISWQEPKPLGAERYNWDRKEISYWVRSYLLYKKDKEKVIKWLEQQNLLRRELPESYKANLSLFNREHYWSPASKEGERERWSIVGDTNFKVMVTTSEAVGELSQDKSGAHFHYEMPCQKIFEGMHLQYASKDGEFVNKTGELVVINPDFRGPLIRRDVFQKFLGEKKLEVVWMIMGKKNEVKGSFSDRRGSSFKLINGVYFFDDRVFKGSLRLLDRE